jgi:hypothetical protein
MESNILIANFVKVAARKKKREAFVVDIPAPDYGEHPALLRGAMGGAGTAMTFPIVQVISGRRMIDPNKPNEILRIGKKIQIPRGMLGNITGALLGGALIGGSYAAMQKKKARPKRLMVKKIQTPIAK